MKKMLKRLCTGFLALATVVTALPTIPVHAESKQYWTESKERVGIVEKVMNDGSIGSTFNEGHLTVEGEDAYCIDINTDFKNGYKLSLIHISKKVDFRADGERLAHFNLAFASGAGCFLKISGLLVDDLQIGNIYL